MAYIDPKTDWNESYEPSPSDMNRIEGNIDELKTGDITISGNKTHTGGDTFNSGVQFNAITVAGGYDITQNNQQLATNSNVTFGSVQTDNVYIKQKLITGTTTGSGNVFTAHGIDQTKILGVDCFVNSIGTTWSSLTMAGTSMNLDSTNITINGGGVSKPYRLILTYEA